MQYINGKWIEGNGDSFSSINPATGEEIWQGNSADQSDIEQAVRAARQASYDWAETSYTDRIKFLQKFSDIIKEKSEELAIALAKDTGKPLWESKTEIAAMTGKLAISEQAYAERCNEKENIVADHKASTRFKPHGVALVICPFNFPGHIPNGHIIPALLAGNTVIVKPSSLTPYISHKIIECWHQAGIPAGTINCLQGDGQVGRNLVNNQQIDGIFFTGSSEVGQSIQSSLAEYPHRIIALEMGGNNPLVVEQISDIDAAVYSTIQSAYITAGQRCTCARRLIVTRSETNTKFVQRLQEVVSKLLVGNYDDDPQPFMGTVISSLAADNIIESYKKLKKDGGESMVSMKKLDISTAFLTPGIIDVTKVANRMDHEIFGPLLKLKWVNNLEDAISEANNTCYGLSAGLLSDDKKSYDNFYRKIRAGIVNWNRPVTGASSSAPFGGIGNSGNHRPSAYFAVDYCSYPVASLESERLSMPEKLIPGILM